VRGNRFPNAWDEDATLVTATLGRPKSDCPALTVADDLQRDAVTCDANGLFAALHATPSSHSPFPLSALFHNLKKE
jgi:hypothetical protein